MFFDGVIGALAPLRNPIGFGTTDFIELALAISLVTVIYSRRFVLSPVLAVACLSLLPVALRLLQLPRHPVPVPDIYDEFGHLFVAQTLRHWRLANPPHALHQFFETFFILQQPAYSSIYPIGNGVALAVGWVVFGTPWAGVLGCTAALCGLCYWMLRGWTTPGWALLGGVLTAMQFGPLNQWTNSYWGGALPAAAGCLVFGALPRLQERHRLRDGALLGLGFGIHLLTRPYESIFLAGSAVLFFFPARWPRQLWKPLLLSVAVILPAIGITLLHNKRVTGEWTRLPYALSQYQYGVPASLTFQQNPTPHIPLTPQQEMGYRMQRAFHPGTDTLRSYGARLLFRIRYYRFYFYPPLYLALLAFLATTRTWRAAWIALTCLLFALGTNFFPAFQYHYLAAVVCLFVLMSVEGLRQITKFPNGIDGVRVLVFVCVAEFVFGYVTDWSRNGTRTTAERRIEVARQITEIPGKLLVFVRYWPAHPFQDEWVYNSADIDSQRVVWARDLGDEEDQQLIAYYGNRKLLLFEPDARPPRLEKYIAAIVPPPEQKQAPASKPPLLQLEQVR